jgi:hypothetical protein
MASDDAQAPLSERGEMIFLGHGGRRPRVLAYGGRSEKWLAQDDRYLYWSDQEDGSITRLHKDGGVPVILASACSRPHHLILDRDFLYWVEGGQTGRVARLRVSGGEVETIAPNVALPERVVVSGDEVAWTSSGEAGFRGIPTEGLVCRAKIGGPASIVASKQKQPTSIVFDDHDIYWTNFGTKRPSYFTDGSLMRAPRSGGRKRWIVHKDQSMPSSLAMDDRFLYWTTAATIFEPYQEGMIWRRPRGGGKSVPVVAWEREHGEIALDATHVYWLGVYTGEIVRVRKEGGEPERILSGRDSLVFCGNLVVDKDRVYWTATDSQKSGGAIWSIAKDAGTSAGFAPPQPRRPN